MLYIITAVVLIALLAIIVVLALGMQAAADRDRR
jgi:hypothetical protein